jgi:exonuclease VII small subunit
MTRTTEPTPDDPVLGLIAKRKAEALARAEKEHKQLEAAAKLFAQGAKLVSDAEENLRKGRDKQDSAIALMLDAGLDNAQVAETLGLTGKAVGEAVKRHKAANAPEGPAPATPTPAKGAARKAAAARPKSVTPVPKTGDEKPAEAPGPEADVPAPADTADPVEAPAEPEKAAEPAPA